jgi:hypothetical protein
MNFQTNISHHYQNILLQINCRNKHLCCAYNYRYTYSFSVLCTELHVARTQSKLCHSCMQILPPPKKKISRPAVLDIQATPRQIDFSVSQY